MTDNISLRKMRYFLTVVECGNIVKAAEKLHVTQPLLSKTIKELEQDTGISLFSRRNRKLELTEAGKYVYTEWTRLIDDMQRVTNHALSIQNTQSTIRVGLAYITMAAVQTTWMVQLHRLRKYHPECEILTSFGNLREIVDDLLNGKNDVVICTSRDMEGLESQLSWQIIDECPSYLYSGGSHPFNSIHKDVWAWEDFRNERFMTIDPNIVEWPYRVLKQFANEAGFEPQIEMYTDNQLNQVMELKHSNAFMLTIQMDDLINNRDITACRMPQMEQVVMAWRTGEEDKVAVLRNALRGI